MRWLWIFSLVLLNWAMPVQASLTAWVQGDVFVQGEAFDLMVEAEKDGDLVIPEFEGLSVLSKRTQSQTSIVNGQVSRAHRWIFTIVPDRAGLVQIPPFELGSERTEAIELDIATREEHQFALPIKISASIQPRQVYPQQQLILEVRLERGLPVENESLTPLELPNIPIRQLDQQTEQQVVNGRRVTTTILRFAIFPQTSGTLEIPALTYQGEAVLASQGQMRFQSFNRFVGAKTQRVVLRTEAQRVNVLPVPNEAQGWWLPAQEVVLQELWDPNPPVFRVGDSVSRQIRLRATGLLGEQLPEWSRELPDSLKAYADPAQVKTSNDNRWVIGDRIQSYAIVPSQPGTVTLPAVEVRWWNLQTSQMEVETLPARTVEILPAALAPPQLQPNASSVGLSPGTEWTSDLSPRPAGLWQWTSVGLLALWISTLGLWFWDRRRQRRSQPIPQVLPPEESPSARQAYRAAQEALRQADPRRARAALLGWLQTWHPAPHPRWGDLLQQFPEAHAALSDLDRRCYGPQPIDWDGSLLLNWLHQLPTHPQVSQDEPLRASSRIWWPQHPS